MTKLVSSNNIYISNNKKLFYLLRLRFNILMSKGFATEISENQKVKKVSNHNESNGRLISWSPWPPANFKTRYPAFPFVLTLLILVIGRWILSISK